VLGKTGGGHALKIIKSGFLSERKVYDTPLAPLVEGSIEIPLRQPADRNDMGNAVAKAVAKCHSERREESLFFGNGEVERTPPSLSRRGELRTERKND